ncbi:MAG TPA: hypothetical protein VJB97_02800 [Candidatus Paceibacterota bacterium]
MTIVRMRDDINRFGAAAIEDIFERKWGMTKFFYTTFGIYTLMMMLGEHRDWIPFWTYIGLFITGVLIAEWLFYVRAHIRFLRGRFGESTYERWLIEGAIERSRARQYSFPPDPIRRT